ncbi:tetratricopeptide repeat protein, partial [Porphyromonas levii]|uniref:tetratricopeptide repeat protein n=1 Tax=Porphyromonas levii TaxID=28114 RepID=UPI001B8BD55E
SAADIEGGNYQAAIDRLSKLSNNAEALNNLGVAYAKLGDTARAIDCFNRAIAAGDAEYAPENLKQLSK